MLGDADALGARLLHCELEQAQPVRQRQRVVAACLRLCEDVAFPDVAGQDARRLRLQEAVATPRNLAIAPA